MVKIGDKEIGIDEGLNLALGSGALINSALWILAPSKVHKFAAKNGSNKAITRIGGTGLLNMGVNHVTAGLRGDAIRNKDHLRVAALQYGVLSAISFNEWRREDNDMRDDRVKGMAIGTAAACGLLLFRALQKAPDAKPVGRTKAAAASISHLGST